MRIEYIVIEVKFFAESIPTLRIDFCIVLYLEILIHSFFSCCFFLILYPHSELRFGFYDKWNSSRIVE